MHSGTRRMSLGSRFSAPADSAKDEEIDGLRQQLQRSQTQSKSMKVSLENELEEREAELRRALAETEQIRAAVAHEKVTAMNELQEEFQEQLETVGKQKIELEVKLRKSAKKHQIALGHAAIGRILISARFLVRRTYFGRLVRYSYLRIISRLESSHAQRKAGSNQTIHELEKRLSQASHLQHRRSTSVRTELVTKELKERGEVASSAGSSQHSPGLPPASPQGSARLPRDIESHVQACSRSSNADVQKSGKLLAKYAAQQRKASSADQEAKQAAKKELRRVLRAVRHIDGKDQVFSRALAKEVSREEARAELAGYSAAAGSSDSSGRSGSTSSSDATVRFSRTAPQKTLHSLIYEHDAQLQRKLRSSHQWDTLLDAIVDLSSSDPTFQTALATHLANRHLEDPALPAPSWQLSPDQPLPSLKHLLDTHESFLAAKDAEIRGLRAEIERLGPGGWRDGSVSPDARSGSVDRRFGAGGAVSDREDWVVQARLESGERVAALLGEAKERIVALEEGADPNAPVGQPVMQQLHLLEAALDLPPHHPGHHSGTSSPLLTPRSFPLRGQSGDWPVTNPAHSFTGSATQRQVQDRLGRVRRAVQNLQADLATGGTDTGEIRVLAGRVRQLDSALADAEASRGRLQAEVRALEEDRRALREASLQARQAEGRTDHLLETVAALESTAERERRRADEGTSALRSQALAAQRELDAIEDRHRAAAREASDRQKQLSAKAGTLEVALGEQRLRADVAADAAASLERTLREAQRHNAELRSRLEEFRDPPGGSRRDLEAARVENEAWSDRCAGLARDKRDAEADAAALRRENHTLKEALHHAQAARDSSRRRVVSLEMELDGAGTGGLRQSRSRSPSLRTRGARDGRRQFSFSTRSRSSSPSGAFYSDDELYGQNRAGPPPVQAVERRVQTLQDSLGDLSLRGEADRMHAKTLRLELDAARQDLDALRLQTRSPSWDGRGDEADSCFVVTVKANCCNRNGW
ncbi:hypothetical protein DIPPA_05092 [Diplonema papillatum]|nr:hypothetical protein DIPPA_05092 [Diplonema papillatum]